MALKVAIKVLNLPEETKAGEREELERKVQDITHDFTKEYPASQKVFDALLEAFIISNDEVKGMQQDTRYR